MFPHTHNSEINGPQSDIGHLPVAKDEGSKCVSFYVLFRGILFLESITAEAFTF